MSEMIQCDKCKKIAYMDSRSEKDAMVRMQIDYVTSRATPKEGDHCESK